LNPRPITSRRAAEPLLTIAALTLAGLPGLRADTSGCGKVADYSDGYCDDNNNNIHCDWDGGDCCLSTCETGRFRCANVLPNCLDPCAKADYVGPASVTCYPTMSPSHSRPPTREPTHRPTPLLAPSPRPSPVPTPQPTLNPSYSPLPSLPPTAKPSREPTPRPTFTPYPSGAPTPKPSATFAPTLAPSRFEPSPHPSASPTATASPTIPISFFRVTSGPELLTVASGALVSSSNPLTATVAGDCYLGAADAMTVGSDRHFTVASTASRSPRRLVRWTESTSSASYTPATAVVAPGALPLFSVNGGALELRDLVVSAALAAAASVKQ